jgi:response regulator RpfG family c-di-GMP phosphodiesterase
MAIFKKENLDPIDDKTATPASRHTVMIVDDKEANVAVMAAILRPYFRLVEVHAGQEALKLIETMPASEALACIVSDHRMPHMTGVELCERAAQLRPQTKRIMVTGFMDLDAIVDSINKAEVYRFIAKPFDAADFLLTVRCAVAAFERQERLAQYHAELESAVPAPSERAVQALALATAAQEELAALDVQLRELRARTAGTPQVG